LGKISILICVSAVIPKRMKAATTTIMVIGLLRAIFIKFIRLRLMSLVQEQIHIS
jgi:hypothetical protein